MENAYKGLEGNRMGICVYLGVGRKRATAQWTENYRIENE